MSGIDMKIVSLDNIVDREEFMEEIVPVKCFYNIKKCEKSNENIIDEIEGDFTYEMFVRMMQKHSIIALGPLLVDHKWNEQISFISSEHDYSYTDHNNKFYYPEIIYRMNPDHNFSSGNIGDHQPPYYYGGVFVFKGILNEILYEYIARYLDKDAMEILEKYHEKIMSMIRKTLLYYVEQSSIRDASIFLKHLHHYVDDAYMFVDDIDIEQRELIEKIVKHYDDDHVDEINCVYDNAIDMLRDKIQAALTTSNMKEDYDIHKFSYYDMDFSYGTICCILYFYDENNQNVISMHLALDHTDGKLEIEFFIRPTSSNDCCSDNLLCKQIIDIDVTKNIIFINPNKLEPLSKYFNMEKFSVFMTRLLNFTSESGPKLYVGSPDTKLSGNRRDRQLNDEMINKKQCDESKVTQD